MGPDVRIHPASQVGNNVSLGAGTRINGPAVLKGKALISIGRYCAIGYGLHVISSNHRVDHLNLQGGLQHELGLTFAREDRGPVEIGNNVWIGDRVTILPGVSVGDGAVVGAASVVTSDIPPFAIAVGVPARVVRQRFPDDVVARLQELRWWDWSPERMQRHRQLFEVSLEGLTPSDIDALIAD